MIKKILVLAWMLASFNTAEKADDAILVAANSDCAEECLNVKEFNSGEAFYLWTTGSVKVA